MAAKYGFDTAKNWQTFAIIFAIFIAKCIAKCAISSPQVRVGLLAHVGRAPHGRQVRAGAPRLGAHVPGGRAVLDGGDRPAVGRAECMGASPACTG